jgi:threonine aldolase
LLPHTMKFLSSVMASICLQQPHPERSPADTLRQLADDCVQLGATSWDVYGDFDKTNETSYLRRFEHDVASEFGKDDAVLMPSGVMAQSIALLINSNDNKRKTFACHESSHVLLHENDAYIELLNLDCLALSTRDLGDTPFTSPLTISSVLGLGERCELLSTLLLELPHRELGGKLTPWEDILAMRDCCKHHNIRFHCDGARIFEAAAGYDKSLEQVAEPFDSVYLSFYKGLGGMSGAMLLGSDDFCRQARIWLRRFGGNLYTLLPYAVSGWAGYNRNAHSFVEKRNRLRQIVSLLTADSEIQSIVIFDPPMPQTNMVHGYLKHSADVCNKAVAAVQEKTGIQVLRRVRPLQEDGRAYQAGYRVSFEWAIGEHNGGFSDDQFVTGWSALAKELDELK